MTRTPLSVNALVALSAIVAMVASTRAVAIAAPQSEQSTSAFEPVAAVLSSPRCANCHFAGDAPTAGDRGRFHGMVVRRGKDGRGTPAMRCTNCHQDASVPVPHAPPGAPDWRLPPPATPMAWKGLTTGEQCRMLKDPSRNGNRTPRELLEHVSHDPLVLGSWSPGPGRNPPPVSHDTFVQQFKAWVDTGAACPG
jgi:hypothetical protein